MIPSLYIHIPFCSQKCDYCDFFSVPENNIATLQADLSYVDSLLEQTQFFVKKFKISSWKTIYVGGGTPSKLGGVALLKLIKGVKQAVNQTSEIEITVEVNPEDITENLINNLRLAGVNRISMGIQALWDKALKAINRKCTEKQMISALELLKLHWNKRLSVDFIAGLPHQSINSFKEQFNKIFSYPVTHISLYTLTVEEGTSLSNKIKKGEIKFSEENCDKMWNVGKNILVKNGFAQYEVSNFSKKGEESVHNLTYWNLENYIGIGSGGCSSVFGENGFRFTNTKNIPLFKEFWLSNKNDYSLEELEEKKLLTLEKLSLQTQEFEYLMMGFRKLSGISKNEFYKRFNKNISEVLKENGGLFFEWVKQKKSVIEISENDERYCLTEKGIMLLNLFLESLL